MTSNEKRTLFKQQYAIQYSLNRYKQRIEKHDNSYGFFDNPANVTWIESEIEKLSFAEMQFSIVFESLRLENEYAEYIAERKKERGY